MRFCDSPWAMAATVPMLHGQTTMPPVKKEPLAMPAPEVSVIVVLDLIHRRGVGRIPEKIHQGKFFHVDTAASFQQQHFPRPRG